MDTEKILNDIFCDFEKFNMDDIPSIDLYMDQVTTYLNGKFEYAKRYDDDKLLTKTMINNYAKIRLLPPPDKKKYSADHIMILTMIYFLKSVISINNINTVLNPLIDSHFHSKDNDLDNMFKSLLDCLRSDSQRASIAATYEKAQNSFTDANEDEREYLQKMSFISLLSYEAFIRKIMVERLIDTLPSTENEPPEKEKSKDKNKEKDK